MNVPRSHSSPPVSAKAGSALLFQRTLNQCAVHVGLNEDGPTDDLQVRFVTYLNYRVYDSLMIHIYKLTIRPSSAEEHFQRLLSDGNTSLGDTVRLIPTPTQKPALSPCRLKLYIMNHQLSSCFVSSLEKIPIWV